VVAIRLFTSYREACEEAAYPKEGIKVGLFSITPI
jgi:hypothetical protein